MCRPSGPRSTCLSARTAVPDSLWQFAGSLAAILALYGVAKHLGLGPEARFAREEDAIEAARQAVDGFDPVEVALDKEGRGGLLCDAAGRILLLRPHGTQMAGRLLTPLALARQEGDVLVVDTAERRFGQARLVLADPQAWVQHVEAMRCTDHA